MEKSEHLDIREAEEIVANLNAGGSLPVSPEKLASQAAEAYLKSIADSSSAKAIYLDLLCILAVSDSRAISSLAVSTLYREVIEGLCDDFTPSGANNANQALAHLIFYTSQMDTNSSMQESLGRSSLYTESDLIERWVKITTPNLITAEEKNKVRRIIIPSRVSAGADIMITSVLFSRLLVAFPNAEITLLGPDHLYEVFHDISRISHHPFDVRRHGSLMDRIMFWPRLIKNVREITEEYNDTEVMIFDPDSRISQLGLLPLISNSKTYHFPSRSLTSEEANGSLAEITNHWLDLILGDGKHLFPQVSLAKSKRTAAESFLELLRENGCANIIVANFGVGGDERKQVADPFEEKVLENILKCDNSIIILDMGSGSDEKSRIEKLIAKASHAGIATAITYDEEMTTFNPGFNNGIIGIRTSIGSLAALISGADCYLGYDSSGQHLANAVSTPSISVFAGYPNQRFIQRWSPVSENIENTIIPVPDPVPKFLEAIDDLAEKTVKAVKNYL